MNNPAERRVPRERSVMVAGFSGTIYEVKKDEPLLMPHIRRVPLQWEHPKNEKGDFVPVDTGGMPSVQNLLDEQVGIAVYEPDGIPISPVFPETPQGRFDMLRHCTENGTINGQERPLAGWAWELYGKHVQVVDLTGRKIILHSGDSTTDTQIQGALPTLPQQSQFNSTLIPIFKNNFNK